MHGNQEENSGHQERLKYPVLFLGREYDVSATCFSKKGRRDRHGGDDEGGFCPAFERSAEEMAGGRALFRGLARVRHGFRSAEGAAPAVVVTAELSLGDGAVLFRRLWQDQHRTGDGLHKISRRIETRGQKNPADSPWPTGRA